jgi:hypothetical protein
MEVGEAGSKGGRRRKARSERNTMDRQALHEKRVGFFVLWEKKRKRERRGICEISIPIIVGIVDVRFRF